MSGRCRNGTLGKCGKAHIEVLQRGVRVVGVEQSADHLHGWPVATPELNHELLSQIGWLIGDESDAVLRWHRRLVEKSDPIDRTWDDVWDPIVGILNHSAVLSRVFWLASNPTARAPAAWAWRSQPTGRSGNG